MRLTDLLTANEQGDAALVHASEAEMPEPISAYLGERATRVMLVPDPFWTPELSVSCGSLRIGTIRGRAAALLIEVTGLGTAGAEVRTAFSQDGIEDGKWAACSESLSGTETDEYLAQLAWIPRQPLSRDGGRTTLRHPRTPRWLGVTFMEEGPQRDQQRRNWIFLRGSGQPRTYQRFQAQAFNRLERDRRLPEMAGLHKRSGLLIGAGSLGSAIAVELVKAGIGHLTVVDHDIYDVNNSVRHVLPLLYAGANKAEALVDHCRRINVFTEVVACTKSVGGSMLPRKLRALVATTDFTIDATGSGEITRLLSRTGQELSRPVLVADLTPSAYGGEVVVGRPGGACAYCFQLEQEADRLPTPPSGPSSGVTPIGCAQPTFFGAGFECSELAAVAARMAVAECGEAGYPTLGYDWAVVSFRSTEHWQSGLLDRSAECPYHS